MIKMLASVRNLAEAKLVLESGVDMIDLKEPAQGALGALSFLDIKEIAEHVQHRKIVSATIGDLPMQPDVIYDAVSVVTKTEVDLIKVGFFNSTLTSTTVDVTMDECIDRLSSICREGHLLIAVLFADLKPDFEILHKLKSAGFFGVMLDTAEKSGLHLLNYLTLADLACFTERAKSLGLFVGLGGSLGVAEIPALLKLCPDYLGFRGALCENKLRQQALNPAKISEICSLLHKNNEESQQLQKTCKINTNQACKQLLYSV